MPPERIRIATRKSPLALWQAEQVGARLAEARPGLEVEYVRMTTTGDRIQGRPLAAAGGKGLFLKELEQGMLEDRADIAVHSLKDVPVHLPEGLHLAAVLAAEDPRDALVAPRHRDLQALPAGARVGTSSLRRRCQLRGQFPQLEVLEVRGNVGTRLAKLDRGEFDAIILAAAGLRRLGLGERITEPLDPEVMLPAVGQGVIVVECRREDAAVNELLGELDDADTRIRVLAERAMNAKLGGSCAVPIAGHAQLAHGVLLVRGLVGRPDGSELVRGVISGDPGDAAELGAVLADDLLSRGADAILEDLYQVS